MANVFISYSSKDKDYADKVLQELERNGIDCWMAPRDIPGGSYYAREIPHAILSCSVFLLILSDYAQTSDYVLRELDYATANKKEIIPYEIRDCDLIPEFDFLLRTKQHYKAFLNPESEMKGMILRIAQIIQNNQIEKQYAQEYVLHDKITVCKACGSSNLEIQKGFMDRLVLTAGGKKRIKDISEGCASIILLGALMLTLLYSYDSTLESKVSIEVFSKNFDRFIFSYLAVCVPVGIVLLFCKKLPYIHELRRRYRVRHRLSVTYLKCNVCSRQFKSVIRGKENPNFLKKLSQEDQVEILPTKAPENAEHERR